MAKVWRDRADREWGKYIRARGQCQRCGARRGLQAAHIIRRFYQGTRVDPRNGWCLCLHCHPTVDQFASEHADMIMRTIGIDGFEELESAARAQHGQRLTDHWWHDRYDELKQLNRGRR